MAVEQTLSIIKPDGVQKNLIGEIYSRFEKAGLEIVAARMMHLSDEQAQGFARELGAVWAGSSDQAPPVALDAALIFAPVGELVPAALAATAKGGCVVCGGIHMSDIPGFPYAAIWGERMLRSVANLTRADAREFMALAPRVPVSTRPVVYALSEANRALDDLRSGRFSGAAVLVPDSR